MSDLEVGDVVEDHDDDPKTRNQAVIINLPSMPADEWRAYADEKGEPVTVAVDNPDYPADADVAVVLFADDLEREHPDWAGDNPIPLADAGAKFYSFPASRLAVIGDIDPGEAKDSDVLPKLQAIADRIEAGGMAVENLDPERGILRASKLGETYIISEDGSVEGGALSDRIEAAVREVNP